MSLAHYDELVTTGRLPATSETFISSTKAFASNYDGVLVQFNLRSGASDALRSVGVRDASVLTRDAMGELPMVGKGWTKNNAFFKGEGDQINVGLGRGTALDIFNAHVESFVKVPK